MPPCSPYEEKITEGSCWNASVPRHSQKSHSFKCWWGQADNTGWIFKFQHLWCFMPSVWECPRGHTATQPLNLHPALKRKDVRMERRRRKTGELKWCSGLNEPPLSLQSHYTATIMWISAAELLWKFLQTLHYDGKVLYSLNVPLAFSVDVITYFSREFWGKIQSLKDISRVSPSSPFLLSLFISQGKKKRDTAWSSW